MNHTIIAQYKVVDGYDVEIERDTGERLAVHFAAGKPMDVQGAVNEVLATLEAASAMIQIAVEAEDGTII